MKLNRGAGGRALRTTGALINSRGELVGINTAVLAQDAGTEGIGFAIPVDLVRGVVDEIKKHGRVIRGWVGITRIRDVDSKLARAKGLSDTRGAVVWEMLRGSPADKAGLQPGDVIIAVDGQSIQHAAALRRALAEASVGITMRITVLREGRRFELSMDVLEARS